MYLLCSYHRNPHFTNNQAVSLPRLNISMRPADIGNILWFPQGLAKRNTRQLIVQFVSRLRFPFNNQIFALRKPLKASLSCTNPYQTTAVLKTFIHVDKPEEVTEITDWLLFLGRDIKVKEMPE